MKLAQKTDSETRPPTRREDNEMRDTNCIPASEPPRYFRSPCLCAPEMPGCWQRETKPPERTPAEERAFNFAEQVKHLAACHNGRLREAENKRLQEAAARLRGEAPPPAECLDCGMAYEDFPMDVILPRAQWLEIHPDEHGLLCAGCIVARASKVPGATACHLIIEVAPK